MTKVSLSLRVHPNASRDEVLGFIDGVLRVKVAAPPLKGKANEKLVAFLSKLLDVNRDSISIVKGQTNRNKVVVIRGLSHEDIMKRLSS